MTDNDLMWCPSPERAAGARLVEFARLAREYGAQDAVRERAGGGGEGAVLDYRLLHRWSVERRELFWPLVARFCGVRADGLPEPGTPGAPWAHDAVGVGLDRMAPPDPERGPRWFPEARLNFAENLLRFRDDRPALVAWNERGRQRELSYAALYAEVARAAAGLRAAGVGPGDRVAGFMPNIPETVVAMLATASLGAIWSSCSPDFGVAGVLDRFGQIAPKVLIVADGYQYNGKPIDCYGRVREIVRQLPSIERFVIVPYLGAFASGDWRWELDLKAALWEDFLTPLSPPAAPLAFVRLPFDHPLYIMYSSGTTGLPKCMVHSVGGTILQHQKEHVLHVDLRREDRLFYFTTCGWMMWNWLVSALAVGATVVLYDGSPMAPSPDVLWDMAQGEGITVFGTSAKYLALIEKQGVEPARTHALPALRTILSTGSPLAAHSFDYVYDRVKRDVHLASISGGTDLISCFVLGDPTAPVYRGEIQAPGLAMAVEVWDPARGERVGVGGGRTGELVCTRPFPSMPTAFWNDPDGSKYRNAYFAHFPNVWRHGDWCEETPHGGYVIYGRSDATLNPGGVRIGTAEIYRVVEQMPEVVEGLAVGQEIPGDEADVRVVLFVRLREGVALDDALREAIRRRIREEASPHHVPKVIVQVADIPRTISNKISELAVRQVIHGRPVENTDALANPEALALYRDLPELRV